LLELKYWDSHVHKLLRDQEMSCPDEKQEQTKTKSYYANRISILYKLNHDCPFVIKVSASSSWKDSSSMTNSNDCVDTVCKSSAYSNMATLYSEVLRIWFKFAPIIISSIKEILEFLLI